MNTKHVFDKPSVETAGALGDDAIRAAADVLINQLGCSPISALCLLFQCAGHGLEAIGGSAAVDYIQLFSKAKKRGGTTQQMQEHMMQAFEGMAQHSDLIVKDTEGSA
jgi:hypothetical protein